MSDIETTKKLAAKRQIDAAIAHFEKSELECAITLAGAAEEALPDPCEGHPFPVLREYPTFKRIGWDWNEARNWLKHDKGPDARTIYQGEAALMIYRAISKYSVTHKEIPNWWRQFLAWGAARDYFPAEIA